MSPKQCQTCNKILNSAWSQTYHKIQVHHFCYGCKEEFATRECLFEHQKHCNYDMPNHCRIRQCDKCNAIMVYRNYLRHIRLKKGQTPHVCNKCGLKSCAELVKHKCKKLKVYHVLPQPIPGKWIVKLEQLDLPLLFMNRQ